MCWVLQQNWKPLPRHDADRTTRAPNRGGRRAVLYQIYPRSFADSNGDGVGDIRGIIDHLDHLEWLGIDGIWLSPITVSPNADWGYDVADFCAVQPDLGTMADFDHLVEQAADRGIRVLLDLVPNHTSVEHPWFVDSRSSRTAARRDWYVWADPGPDGAPPNNWVSGFGGPAWTLDPGTGQYYLHNHLVEQPDLNWWNEEVRTAFDAVFASGSTGAWPDSGSTCATSSSRTPSCGTTRRPTEDDDFDVQLFGQKPVYNGNRPEVHDVLRRWRKLTDGYDPARVLIGETPVKVDALAAYYGDGPRRAAPGLQFPLHHRPLRGGGHAPGGGGHRVPLSCRVPGRPGPGRTTTCPASPRAGPRGDPAKIRTALLMLLCLRGTPVLYQGDEIGLGDRPVAHEDMRDPLGVAYFPAYAGRDAMRTPMPWRPGPAGASPRPAPGPGSLWGTTGEGTVEDQRLDPESVLTLARDLIALRRRTPELQTGAYASLAAPDGVWAWRRGCGTRGGPQPERRRRRPAGHRRPGPAGHRPGTPGHGCGGNAQPGALGGRDRRPCADPWPARRRPA